MSEVASMKKKSPKNPLCGISQKFLQGQQNWQEQVAAVVENVKKIGWADVLEICSLIHAMKPPTGGILSQSFFNIRDLAEGFLQHQSEGRDFLLQVRRWFHVQM